MPPPINGPAKKGNMKHYLISYYISFGNNNWSFGHAEVVYDNEVPLTYSKFQSEIIPQIEALWTHTDNKKVVILAINKLEG